MEGQMMKAQSRAIPRQPSPLPGPEPQAAGQVAASSLPCPVLLAALATAFLLWLSYFPVAWGWLGWVALVPLLCLVRSEAKSRRIYLCAWAAGLAFFVPALQWMRVADLWMYAAWLALAVYISLYLPAGLLLLRLLDRGTRFSLVVTLPVVWTALELLRAHLISGFPWYFLGHTQHNCLPVIQISDLAGAYAVTFLVAAVNAVLFELLYRWKRFRAWFALPAEVPFSSYWKLALPPAVALLLLGASLGYGYWRLSQADFREGPRVALLQGNIKQSIRNDAAGPEGAAQAKQIILKSYEELCQQAARQRPRPDLIVWPETSFVEKDWWDLSPDVPSQVITPSYRKKLAEFQAPVRGSGPKYGTNILLGLEARIYFWKEEFPRKYNSAVLVQPDGKVAGRYDKIHRVPFGEFVPFREELPWMDFFNAYGYDFSVHAGESWTRLPLGKYRFGVLICYEDTDPTLAREYALQSKEGPAADFLVNISNDGWFDGTSEHDEHLAICRFRAVESRRPVVRSVNMGISAVIDGNGRVLKPATVSTRDQMSVWEIQDPLHGPGLSLADWHHFKKVQGVLLANLPLDGRDSLYARWGDWLPWACWVGVAAGLAWVFVRRLKVRGKVALVG
jgi:apolipoprotein N-acyltransferase